MDLHNVDPAEFLAFVHEIDRTSLAPHPELGEAIAALPGRKLIFTNGPRHHATETALQLGIHHHFEDIFDIVAADLIPKPAVAAYEMFFKKHDVNPKTAAMFEDIAKNLVVPHLKGMVTTLVIPQLGLIDHRDEADRTAGTLSDLDAAFIDFAHFAIPGDINIRNGGYGYNRQILSRMPDNDIAMQHVELPASLPLGTSADMRLAIGQLAKVPADQPVLIDSLGFSCLPRDMIAGVKAPIIALVHHPLARESGLNAEQVAHLQKTETEALALAQAIVVSSPYTARTLMQDFGVSGTKITVAEPGTATATRATGSGSETVHLLAVGSLIPRKGYDVLLDALAAVSALNWQLTIAGSPTLDCAHAAHLQNRIAQEGLSGRIRLLGDMAAAELDQIYAQADVFVMPSLFEGYGMALTEAMIRGLPVLCTTGGASNETVPDGVGIKVPPHEVEPFADGLRALIAHPALRRNLAEMSWAHGQTLPSWDDSAAKIAVVVKSAKRWNFVLQKLIDDPVDPIVSVERVMAELRAGRDVLLSDADSLVRITGVEHMGARAATRLVLSAARLRWLGAEVVGGAALDVSPLNPVQIFELACGKQRVALPALNPASALELAAIELAKLALVLPAILVSPVHGAHLLEAPASAIGHYIAARTAALQLVTRAPVPLEGAENSEFVIFRGGEGLRDQVAIVIGQPDLSQPVPVRLHSACLTGDLFGSLKCDCGDQLRSTTKAMAEGTGGIILYLDQEGRGTGIGNKMRAYSLQAQGLDTFDADEILGFEHDERHFAFAGRMLQLLGVNKVRLMTNNPAKVAALREAGLEVTETLAIQGRLTSQNRGYLQTKRDRGGHLLDLELAARTPE
eukprot:gene2456-2494_t